MENEHKSSKIICGTAVGLWIYTSVIWFITRMHITFTSDIGYKILNIFANIAIFVSPIIAFVIPVILLILFLVHTIEDRRFNALPFFTLIANIGYSVLLYNMLEGWF